MNGQALSLIVAAWGAILSTLLAGRRVWEVWRDRHRIDIGYSFCSDEGEGNTISIRNVSGRPLILSYWELQYGRGRWPFTRFETFQSPEPEEVSDCKIEPYTSYPLTFTDAEHFDWGSAVLRGRSVYRHLMNTRGSRVTKVCPHLYNTRRKMPKKRQTGKVPKLTVARLFI